MRFSVSFRVGAEKLDIEGRAPARPVTPVEFLPVVQEVCDGIIGVRVREVERQGRRVSCAAGCGACCRQVVPISEIEAAYLCHLIETMPEARRVEVRERFRDVLARLGKADFLNDVRESAALKRGEESKLFGLKYFKLGLACPFLENESCSIHPHRPLACREYLVTSKPALCAGTAGDLEASAGRIKGVEMPLQLSKLLYRFGDARGKAEPRFLPLVLALEWGDKEGLARQWPRLPVSEMLDNFIQALAE